MAIISESKIRPPRAYRSAQSIYAMTYVAITFVVLLFLNIYCSKTSQRLFYESKEKSMLEKCQLASDEIATLEVLNPSTVSGILSQMESLKVTRLIVTDQSGLSLYDSLDQAEGSYCLFPEIITALDSNDVFSWNYRSGSMDSRAATPIFYYGTVVGCVYISESDASQGRLIEMLQRTLLQVTLILEIAVTLFSILYATRFSSRVAKIMASMRIIQKGDYSHKLNIGGHDELTVLGNEFNDLTEKLQTSEQKRSRFVSDASHELKTPLASIKLLTDSILQNEMDADTMREFVQDIGNEADRLTRMTGKLLSLTKVDVNIQPDMELVTMAPTVQKVTRMLEPVAQQSGISIHLDLEQDSSILVQEDDLYQIVFNLMENGIKYNRSGGQLTVTLSRQDEDALLSVRDTGIGIPEESLSHIFERFYRVDKARSRATGGSGLGLAIVKAIVRRNRGEISVTSVSGEGTCFTVSFPIFDTEEPQEETQ